MQGTLAAGDFVRLAWRLAREAATGRLWLEEDGAAHELYLRRGYLTYARVTGADATIGRLLIDGGAVDDAGVRRALAAAGPRLAGQVMRAQGTITEAQLDAALRRQAELRLVRLACMQRAAYRFEPGGAPPASARSGRPLALAAWVRAHLAAAFDGGRARALIEDLGGGRLQLSKDLAPEPGDCDPVERRVLESLATPRRLDEIARAAAAPQLRLLGFLWFLRRVGALAPYDVAPRPVDPVLGVAADASPDAVKQAYRRLARALHPDLNPDADPARLRELMDAYRAFRARKDEQTYRAPLDVG